MSIDKEIKKLKEIHKADFYLILETINKRTKMIMDNRKVLREFNEALLGKNIIGVSFYRDMKDKLGGEKSGGMKDTLVNEVIQVQHSKPPSCEFCGRDLIYYEEKWICGHGCIKPAVNPSEQDAGSARQTDNERQFITKCEECANDICMLTSEDMNKDTCWAFEPRKKEKEPTEALKVKYEYDDHLSFQGNVRELLKGKVVVDIKDLKMYKFQLFKDNNYKMVEQIEKKYEI